MNDLKVLLLAGGVGSRMKKLNDIPKVFQMLGDKPMIVHLVDSFIKSGVNPEKIHIVLSPETLRYATENKVFKNSIKPIIQKVSDGSGGAVITAMEFFEDTDRIMICNGDNPLITCDTIETIANSEEDFLSVMKTDDPTGYGRIVLENGYITKIIEEKDCSEEEKKIKLVNTSIFLTNGKDLKNSLNKINTNNAQNEYYLTDIVLHQKFRPYLIKNNDECFNINTPEQLAQGELLYFNLLKPDNKHK